MMAANVAVNDVAAAQASPATAAAPPAAGLVIAPGPAATAPAAAASAPATNPSPTAAPTAAPTTAPAAAPVATAPVAASVAPAAAAVPVTPAPVAPTAAAPTPATQPPAVTPQAAPPAAPISAIQIPRPDLDRALGDFAALSQQLQVTAQPQGGFRISQLQPGSFVARVGLRNDDVLLRVDGRPINGADDAAAAYAWLRVTNHFSIDILRHGLPMTLHYVIAPPQPLTADAQ
jgi:hypothetical protein